MLTKKQREILSEIIDLNWDCKNEKSPLKKFELAEKLNKKKNELRKSMGVEAYNNYMEMGARMFS